MSAIGKKWTIQEEAQLINEISQKLSYENIADIHDRNINGIKSRHLKLLNTIKKIEQLTILLELSSINELFYKIKSQDLITNPLYDYADDVGDVGEHATHNLK